MCEARLPGVPEALHALTGEGGFPQATSLIVCAYRRESEDGPVSLTYAARADEVADITYNAVARGEHKRLRCTSAVEGSEWVVLQFAGKDALGPGDLTHRVVLYLSGAGCPRAQLNGNTAYVLTPAMVEPWAVGGIPYVVYGPTGGKGAMIDSFIPGWN